MRSTRTAPIDCGPVSNPEVEPRTCSLTAANYTVGQTFLPAVCGGNPPHTSGVLTKLIVCGVPRLMAGRNACPSRTGHNRPGGMAVIRYFGQPGILAMSDRPYIEINTAAGNKQLVLGREPISIGRHSENKLVLADNMASRFHCVIEKAPDGYLLRDLGASNGTFVNGRKVKSA